MSPPILRRRLNHKTAEQKRNNQDDIQDGDCNKAPPMNPCTRSSHLATLIGNVIYQKLKNEVPRRFSQCLQHPLRNLSPQQLYNVGTQSPWPVYFHSHLRQQPPTFLNLQQHHHLLSLITFQQRPSKLFYAVSALSLICCCQITCPF